MAKGRKGVGCRRDERGYVGYIAEDDFRVSSACSEDEAIKKFRKEHGVGPLRVSGIIKLRGGKTEVDVFPVWERYSSPVG